MSEEKEIQNKDVENAKKVKMSQIMEKIKK